MLAHTSEQSHFIHRYFLYFPVLDYCFKLCWPDSLSITLDALDLVAMVERTVKSENQRSPRKPIYLVGESLGACIALAVAACNPEIDLLLILSNPGDVHPVLFCRTLSFVGVKL